MLKLLAALGLAFALSALPALAQTDADTDAAVDSSLGDHTAYRAAFDAIQKAVAEGDKAGFRATLDPTVPLARLIFRAPTQYYKTGVVFLAWLNGFQDHFIMLNGAQAMRPLPYFVDLFRHADQCGLLRDPELAVERMKKLLALYGV